MQLWLAQVPAMTAVSVYPVKKPTSAGVPQASQAPRSAASRPEPGSRSMAGRSPVMTYEPWHPGTSASAEAMASSTMRVAASVVVGGTRRMSIQTRHSSGTT